MENYNTEAVISARDNGFTSTIDSVLSSLKNLEGASGSAVKSVESCADAIAGMMDSVAGLGDLQELCDAMKTFGNATKTAFDMIASFSGKMNSIIKFKETISGSTSNMKGLASEAEKAPKSVLKGMKGIKYSLSDMFSVAPIQKKAQSLGTSPKNKFELAEIGGTSSAVGPYTGKLIEIPPNSGKAIDQMTEKVANMPLMIGKIGPAFQSTSKIGTSAMFSMTSVISGALKRIGPAAIVGAALAGLGLLQGQFGDQINGLLQIAVEQGPQIIQSLVDGIVNSLPVFMEAGSGLLVNLLDAITANLPVIVQGGIQIISSLVQGFIDNLPQIIPAALSLLTTLIDAILTNLPTLVQMGLLVIVALITGIADNLPQIITSGIELIITLLAGIGSMLPDILAAGWEIIKALGLGIIKAIPEILAWAFDGIKGLFSDLWDFITGKNEEGVDKTSEKMDEFATGLTDKTYSATTQAKVDLELLNTEGSANIDNLLQNVGNLGNTMQTVPVEGMAVMQEQCGASVTTMESDVSEGMNRIVDSTTVAMESFGQAIQAGMTDAQSKVTTGVDGITDVFTPLSQKLYSIGTDVMSGLTNGINDSASLVYDAARAVADGIADIMNKALIIGSPSKVTTKIGEYAGIGPAIGMLNMLPKVEKASARLADAMQPVVTSDFLGAGSYGSGSGRISVGTDGQTMTNAYLRMVLNDIRKAVCEQGNKTYVFEAPLNLEGKQIAKASAVYTQEEINRKEKLLKRMGGYR